MYKLICRSINKSNKSLTKFTDIYKKVSKNQHHAYLTSAAKGYDGEEKDRSAGRLAELKSGTSFSGRAKITFKTLLFPKRTGGQLGKLTTKSFYSTGHKPKDAPPKKYFKDKFAYCMYKNAMEQCDKIRTHSPTPGNTINWNAQSVKPLFIEEERRLSKKPSKPKYDGATNKPAKPKIVTEKYVIHKKTKKGFPATTVKIGNKTKIIYPVKRLQYTLNQQTRTTPVKREPAETAKKGEMYRVNQYSHTVEFIPKKIDSTEEELNSATLYKKYYGRRGGNSGDSGSQASRGGSSGGGSKRLKVDDDAGYDVSGFTDPKVGAPGTPNPGSSSHGRTGGNSIRMKTPGTAHSSAVKEDVLIQKHPKIRKATKYGKMDINKKYNILLKMHQNKKKLGYHVVKSNERKGHLRENEAHQAVDPKALSNVLENPAAQSELPELIVSHPAMSQEEPQLNMDPLKYRKSVITDKNISYDIDEICFKSNDKSAHRIQTINRQADSKVNQTVRLKEEPRFLEKPKATVQPESSRRAVTPEKIMELIDNRRLIGKQDIAARNLENYLSKLQISREQTSVDKATRIPVKSPSLVQEAEPQKIEKEEPPQSMKKVVNILQPGELFPKQVVPRSSAENLEKKQIQQKDTASIATTASVGLSHQTWQANGSQEADINKKILESISATVSENISKRFKLAEQKRKGRISQFDKLMEHSNRELKKIGLKSGKSRVRGTTTKLRKKPKYLLENYQPNEKVKQELKKANLMKKLLDTYAVKIDSTKEAERSEVLSNMKINEILTKKGTQKKKRKVFLTDMELVPTKIGSITKLVDENDASKMEKKSRLLTDIVVSKNVDTKEKATEVQPSLRTDLGPKEDVQMDNVSKKYLLSDYSKSDDKKDGSSDSTASASRRKEIISLTKSPQQSDTDQKNVARKDQEILNSKSFVPSQHKRDMKAFQSLTELKEKVKEAGKRLIVKAETSPQKRPQKKEREKQMPAAKSHFGEKAKGTAQKYRYLLSKESTEQPDNVHTPIASNSGEPNENSISRRITNKQFLLENYLPKKHPTKEHLLDSIDSTSFKTATKEEVEALTLEKGPNNVRSNKLEISYPKVTNEMITSNREMTSLISAANGGTDQSTTREKPSKSIAEKNVLENDTDYQHRRNLDGRNKCVPQHLSSDNFARSAHSQNRNQSQKISDLAEDDLLDKNVQKFYKNSTLQTKKPEEYGHKKYNLPEEVKIEVPKQQIFTTVKCEEVLSNLDTKGSRIQSNKVAKTGQKSAANFSMNIRHPQIPRQPPPPPPSKDDSNKKEKPKGKRDFILPPPKRQPTNTKLTKVMGERHPKKLEELRTEKPTKVKIRALKFKYIKPISRKTSPIDSKKKILIKNAEKIQKEVFIKPIRTSEQTEMKQIYNNRILTERQHKEDALVEDLHKNLAEEVDRSERTENAFRCKRAIERNVKAMDQIKKLRPNTPPGKRILLVKTQITPQLREEPDVPREMKSSYTVEDDRMLINIKIIKKNEELSQSFLDKNREFTEKQDKVEEVSQISIKSPKKIKAPQKFYDHLVQPEQRSNINSEKLAKEVEDVNLKDQNIEIGQKFERLRQKVVGEKGEVVHLSEGDVIKKLPAIDYDKRIGGSYKKKVRKTPTSGSRKDKNSESNDSKNKKDVDDVALSISDIEKNIGIFQKNEELRRRTLGRRKVFKEDMEEVDDKPDIGSKLIEKSKYQPPKSYQKERDIIKPEPEIEVDVAIVEKLPKIDYEKIKENMDRRGKYVKSPHKMEDDKICPSADKNLEIIKKNEEIRRRIFSIKKGTKEVQNQQEGEFEANNKNAPSKSFKTDIDISKDTTEIDDGKSKKLCPKKDKEYSDRPEFDTTNKLREIDYDKSKSVKEKPDYTKEAKSSTAKSSKSYRIDISPEFRIDKKVNSSYITDDDKIFISNCNTRRSVGVIKKSLTSESSRKERSSMVELEKESISREMKSSNTVEDDKILVSRRHIGTNMQIIKENDHLRRKAVDRRKEFKEDQHQLDEQPEVIKANEKNDDDAPKEFEKDLGTRKDTRVMNIENLRDEIQDINQNRKSVDAFEKFEKLRQKIVGGQNSNPKSIECDSSHEIFYEIRPSQLAKVWRVRDAKLINEENLKHEIASKQFLREIRCSDGKRDDSLAATPSTIKLQTNEVSKIYVAKTRAAKTTRNLVGDVRQKAPNDLIRDIKKERVNDPFEITKKPEAKDFVGDIKKKELKDLVGDPKIIDNSNPQKKTTDSKKMTAKDAKHRSYSKPVSHGKAEAGPDVRSEKQYKCILDDTPETTDKLDAQDKQKESSITTIYCSVNSKKYTNLLTGYPKSGTPYMKCDKNIINVEKSPSRVDGKQKKAKASSPHVTPRRSQTAPKLSLTSPTNTSLSRTEQEIPSQSSNIKPGKFAPAKSKDQSERAKQNSKTSSSLQSKSTNNEDSRSLSPIHRTRSEASYYAQYKQRVQSVSPGPKRRAESEKSHETKKYDSILEEKEGDDCFSGGRHERDDKKGKPGGGMKASGGGSKKSKLVVNLMLPKLELKKDTPGMVTSTPTVTRIREQDTRKVKEVEKASPPTKAASAASVPQKPLGTSLTPTAKKKSCRLNDFVCADCFVKAKEETKENENTKDLQAEFKQLLDDPCSKILSSKYLLEPKKAYSKKSCRLDEFEDSLSNFLTPKPEQKIEEKNLQEQTSETKKPDSEGFSTMDAMEVMGNFVNQKKQEIEPKPLLRATARLPKPKSQESKQQIHKMQETKPQPLISVTATLPESNPQEEESKQRAQKMQEIGTKHLRVTAILPKPNSQEEQSKQHILKMPETQPHTFLSATAILPELKPQNEECTQQTQKMQTQPLLRGTATLPKPSRQEEEIKQQILNMQETKSQPLLRATAALPKSKPQEEESKQQIEAPEKQKPEEIDITKSAPEAFHEVPESVEELVGENKYHNALYYSYNKDSYYDLYVFQHKFRTSK
ncbi:unnamed protein product [Acanthoscelides obtectus]|uniref:Uncharacterized protein n=2 Tax=Acanthoscelides obtectus TaxID=200917 RepID=A0A9P0KW46_ACAOB|nr:unnamed protein product [Acanthoscelides obtectus]CAK1660684.1 hypothetical protein AOBTE_LOCUS22218 [Acanthoscelides obtectus]